MGRSRFTREGPPTEDSTATGPEDTAGQVEASDEARPDPDTAGDSPEAEISEEDLAKVAEAVQSLPPVDGLLHSLKRVAQEFGR